MCYLLYSDEIFVRRPATFLSVSRLLKNLNRAERGWANAYAHWGLGLLPWRWGRRWRVGWSRESLCQVHCSMVRRSKRSWVGLECWTARVRSAERGPTKKRVLEKVVDYVDTFISGMAAWRRRLALFSVDFSWFNWLAGKLNGNPWGFTAPEWGLS